MRLSLFFLLFTIGLNAQNVEDKSILMTNNMCNCIDSYGEKMNEKKFEKCLKKLFRKHNKDLDLLVDKTFKHDTILPKAFVVVKVVKMLSESLVENCPAYISFYDKLQKDKLIAEVSTEVCEKLESNKSKNIENDIFDLSTDILIFITDKKDELREVLKSFTSEEDKYNAFNDLEVEVRRNLSKNCKIYKKLKRQLN